MAKSPPQQGGLASTDDSLFCDLIDNLFQDSRDTNSIVFRGEYPTEALMDDIAVYQPLEFIHECFKLRHQLLSAMSKDRTGGSGSDLSMSRKITTMGRVSVALTRHFNMGADRCRNTET